MEEEFTDEITDEEMQKLLEIVIEKLPIIKPYLWKFIKEEKTEALEMLKIAKKDLRAAVTMYNTSLYPQAVFNIQQTVEKLGKSLFLYFGVVENKDLSKKIGHNLSQQTLKKAKQILQFISEIIENDFVEFVLKLIEKLIQQLEARDESQTIVLDNEVLGFFLEVFDEILVYLISLEDEIKEEMALDFETMEETIVSTLIEKRGYNIPEKDQKMIFKMAFSGVKEFLTPQLIMHVFVLLLFIFYIVIIGINLDIHAVKARYATDQEKKYNKNSEIIKMFTRMCYTIWKIITIFEQMSTFEKKE